MQNLISFYVIWHKKSGGFISFPSSQLIHPLPSSSIFERGGCPLGREKGVSTAARVWKREGGLRQIHIPPFPLSEQHEIGHVTFFLLQKRNGLSPPPRTFFCRSLPIPFSTFISLRQRKKKLIRKKGKVVELTNLMERPDNFSDARNSFFFPGKHAVLC